MAEMEKVTEELKMLEKKLKKESVGRERLRVDLDKLQREREDELRKEAERVKQSYDDEVKRIKAEKTENEAGLRMKFEEEKRKRKQLVERIRQAQQCGLM
jgi:hypothetical protein